MCNGSPSLPLARTHARTHARPHTRTHTRTHARTHSLTLSFSISVCFSSLLLCLSLSPRPPAPPSLSLSLSQVVHYLHCPCLLPLCCVLPHTHRHTRCPWHGCSAAGSVIPALRQLAVRRSRTRTKRLTTSG